MFPSVEPDCISCHQAMQPLSFKEAQFFPLWQWHTLGCLGGVLEGWGLPKLIGSTRQIQLFSKLICWKPWVGASCPGAV